jgi:hypothetical protein
MLSPSLWMPPKRMKSAYEASPAETMAFIVAS